MRAITSALTGILGLVALQAVVSRGGSGRITEAFGVVTSFIDRALDPTIAAIPDRRSYAKTSTTASPTVSTFTYPSLPTTVSA